MNALAHRDRPAPPTRLDESFELIIAEVFQTPARQATQQQADAAILNIARDVTVDAMPRPETIISALRLRDVAPADINRLWEQIIAVMADTFDAASAAREGFAMGKLTEKQIIQLVSNRAFPERVITLDTTLAEANFDSLDWVMLSMDIEEAARIDIPDDVLALWTVDTTVKQVLASVADL